MENTEVPIQSVDITTKVVNSNPVHGEVYSIQHYVIKFVSDLLQSVVFSTNKTDLHDIIKILLKVALNSINQPSEIKIQYRINPNVPYSHDHMYCCRTI